MDDMPPETPETGTDEELSQEELLTLLKKLKAEHRAIDNEIKAITETGVTDMLKIKRMKKIKLSIKDKLAYVENQVTPDIIA